MPSEYSTTDSVKERVNGMTNRAFFVVDYSVMGGVERVNSVLADLFTKHQIPFSHLISLYQSNPTVQIQYPANLEVIVFSEAQRKQIAASLHQVLVDNKITSLIFQGDNMSIALAVLKGAKSAKCKAILHYHGSPFGYLTRYVYASDIKEGPSVLFKKMWSYLRYPFKKLKLKKVIAQASDGFVCVSNGVEREIKAIFKNDEGIKARITSIKNPLPFTPDPDCVCDKKKHVVYVSRLSRKHKNSLLALRAWQFICDAHPDWSLRIIGDGPLRQKMEAFCERNHLTNVSFLGNVREIESSLRYSSISISTSDCEGASMSLLEVAAFKNAIVATRSDGGVADLIVDGVSGYLVPKNDPSALAAKLELLMRDPAKRAEFGENVFKRLSDYRGQLIVERWKSLL